MGYYIKEDPAAMSNFTNEGAKVIKQIERLMRTIDYAYEPRITITVPMYIVGIALTCYMLVMHINDSSVVPFGLLALLCGWRLICVAMNHKRMKEKGEAKRVELARLLASHPLFMEELKYHPEGDKWARSIRSRLPKRQASHSVPKEHTTNSAAP